MYPNEAEAVGVQPRGPAGPPGITFAGLWNSLTVYNPRMVVLHGGVDDNGIRRGGALYVATRSNIEKEPGLSPEHWSLLLPGGPTGPAGATGPGAGLYYLWDAGTIDDNPGAGKIRVNHASPGSATALYLSTSNASGATVTNVIETWDDSTSTIKGTLILSLANSPATFAVFHITGAVVAATGYRKLTLTPLAAGGVFPIGQPVIVTVLRTGEKGDTSPAAWKQPVAFAAGIVATATDPKTVVTHLGETYVCTTAHTTTAAFVAANWIKVAQKGDTGPAAWKAPVAFAAGIVATSTDPKTVVIYLGETYVCTVAHTTTAAFVPGNWIKIAAKGTDGNMVGPGASINGEIPVFNGTSGTTLAGSGVHISSILTRGQIVGLRLAI